MPTKDPNIAIIDAHQELAAIQQKVKAAADLVRNKAVNGLLTIDDKHMLAAIRQEAIDATRRVQDRLYEELESHVKQGGDLVT